MRADPSKNDRSGSFFIFASRLGQRLLNRGNQLPKILRSGFVNDTEQVGPLFIFIGFLMAEAKKARLELEFVPGSDEDGGGRWRYDRELPSEGWPLAWDDVRFTAQCTPFRHLGFFPDMAPVWEWMREILPGTGRGTARRVVEGAIPRRSAGSMSPSVSRLRRRPPPPRCATGRL